MTEEQQSTINDELNRELEAAPDMPENEQEAAADDNPFHEFVQHQRIALEELGRAIESLLPKEFREHTHKAGRAFIDSFRALVDATRETVENVARQASDDDDKQKADSPNPTKIKVELD